MACTKGIAHNSEFYVVVILPLLLVPLLLIEDDEILPTGKQSTKFKCLYILILMAIYWMIEALPLAVTALLPIIFLPLFGIQSTGDVSMNYMKETNIMFIGSLIIAMAVEYCNLHRRIALYVLNIVGVSPKRLLLGIMLTTAFLSMWMTNTACASMVCPIAMAIIEELFPKPGPPIPPPGQRAMKRRDSIFKEKSDTEFEAFVEQKDKRRASLVKMGKSADSAKAKGLLKQMSIVEVDESKDVEEENGLHMDKEEVKILKEAVVEEKKIGFKKMLLFAILLSANLGGIAVIIGTASNLAFLEVINLNKVDISQGGKYTDLTFATWMAYNIPPMITAVLLCALFLSIYYLGWKSEAGDSPEEIEKLKRVGQVLKVKKEMLGTMSFHEKAVLFLFSMVVALWFFRDPKFMPGWAQLFHVKGIKINDSTPAMLTVLLLFVIPRELGTFCGINSTKKTPALLDWKYVQSNLPWGVILLLGGGFALSSAVVSSGLSKWLGDQLIALQSLPMVLILVIVSFLTMILTEVASNSACVTVITPILLSLSETLKIHPLYLSLPATIVCSYGFLLPVSTPTNAIVFAAGGGDITIKEMAKVLLVPNIICVLVTILFHISYANLIFDFNNYEYAA